MRLNGERFGDEYFLSLHSIYHALNFRKMTYPIKDNLTYRAYYSTYDLLPYFKEGENLIEIRLGNGFYHQKERICEGDWSYGESLGVLTPLAFRTLLVKDIFFPMVARG